jgi:hypothetical protein
MKTKLNITTTDGELIEVIAIVPDFIAWERYSKRRVSDLVNGIGIEDMAYIAYSALKRQGNVKPFDSWINTVSEIEEVELDPKVIK